MPWPDTLEHGNGDIGAAPGWGALLSGRNAIRSLTLAGGVALHATNVFIATTIMPSVVKDIGGLPFYAWSTTAFVVASILGSSLSTKLLRVAGPRGAYASAALLFAFGALICAIAPAMPVFLLGRFLQGCGGGLLLAFAYAMIRLVFPESLWPRAITIVSGMWGVATLLGPAIGGAFAELGRMARGVLDADSTQHPVCAAGRRGIAQTHRRPKDRRAASVASTAIADRSGPRPVGREHRAGQALEHRGAGRRDRLHPLAHAGGAPQDGPAVPDRHIQPRRSAFRALRDDVAARSHGDTGRGLHAFIFPGAPRTNAADRRLSRRADRRRLDGGFHREFGGQRPPSHPLYRGVAHSGIRRHGGAHGLDTAGQRRRLDGLTAYMRCAGPASGSASVSAGRIF